MNMQLKRINRLLLPPLHSHLRM